MTRTLNSGQSKLRGEVMGPSYGYDPNPDYEITDEAEFFFKYLTWGLRGVDGGGGYPPQNYPPI